MLRTYLFSLLSLPLFASCVPLAERTWTQRFIEPVSAGTVFESPVIDSNVEAHVVRQEFPDDSIFGGGGFNLYAVQARFAVTDRLAVIATKDGYIDLDPDNGSDEEGAADIAGGVKYAAYMNEESGVIITPGLIVETTTGDEDVFQGNGDGLLRPFVSFGWDRGELDFLGELAYNQPLDDDEEASSFDYHVQVSYEAVDNLFPLLGVHGITYTSDGDALPVSFEGGDLINLGSTDVSGNTVIWGALGAAYLFNERVQVGFAYEFPWTSREDLLDERFWFSVLWRF